MAALAGLWRRFVRTVFGPRMLEVVRIEERPGTEPSITATPVARRIRKVTAGPFEREDQTVFVRYRVDGEEFWWWPTPERPVLKLPERGSARRTSRIVRAELCRATGDRRNVTSAMQALAGHTSDFHEKTPSDTVVRRMLLGRGWPARFLEGAKVRTITLPSFEVKCFDVS